MTKLPEVVQRTLDTQWQNAVIPTMEYDKLLHQIKLAFGAPSHPGRRFQGLQALETLQGYNPVRLREQLKQEMLNQEWQSRKTS